MGLLILVAVLIVLGVLIAMLIAFVSLMLTSLAGRISYGRAVTSGLFPLLMILPSHAFHIWINSLDGVDGPEGFVLTVIWIAAWSTSFLSIAFFAGGLIESRSRSPHRQERSDVATLKQF
jgi:hypothetical protein